MHLNKCMSYTGKMCCHYTMANVLRDDTGSARASSSDDVTTAMATLSLDSVVTSSNVEQPVGVGSAKLDALADQLRVLTSQPSPEGPPNKVVIVSQWTSFLDIIADQVLHATGMRCVPHTSTRSRNMLKETFYK